MNKLVKNHIQLWWTIFGIVFGICFPILGSIILASESGEGFWHTFFSTKNNLLNIIHTAPVVLGGVFCFIGHLFKKLVKQSDSLQDEVDLKTKELKDRYLELESVFNAIPCILFYVDPDGVISNYRAQSQDLLYMGPAQFLNKKMTDVLPSSLKALFSDTFDEVKRTHSTKVIGYELETPSGSSHFTAHITPFKDGFLDIIFDTSELSKKDKAIQEGKEQLARLETVKAMTVSICHEINNPLTIAYGFLERMKKNPNLDDGLLESMEKMENSFLRLKEIMKKIESLNSKGIDELELEDYANKSKMFKVG